MVHGWSVQSTESYGGLPRALERAGYAAEEVFLGKYVTLDDGLEVRDIARAFQHELTRLFGARPWRGPFHIVTHSTGALVVKHWLAEYYAARAGSERPLGNVVFLAGPHFGTRLAHHGRTILAEIGLRGDTGRGVLAALELGSTYAWESAGRWLDPAGWTGLGVRPYCITGGRVNRAPWACAFPPYFEDGSDMVVRAASANLNCRRFRLDWTSRHLEEVLPPAGGMLGPLPAPGSVPTVVLDEFSHSGKDTGILQSIGAGADAAAGRNIDLILRCLGVADDLDYAAAGREFGRLTGCRHPGSHRFSQLDFRFLDDGGAAVEDFYFELGRRGPGGGLEAVDAVRHRHRNRLSPHHLTVYVDYDAVDFSREHYIRLRADPGSGLLSYRPADSIDGAAVGFIAGDDLARLVRPDATSQVEVVLRREPSPRLFELIPGAEAYPPRSWDRRGRCRGAGWQPG